MQVKNPKKWYLTSNTLVFSAVWVGTFLCGTVIWRPTNPTFHVEATVDQKLTTSDSSDPSDEATLLLQAFLNETDHPSNDRPTAVKAVESTDWQDTALATGNITIANTLGDHPTESSVSIRAVTEHAGQTLADIDAICQHYVTFARHWLEESDAAHRQEKVAQLAKLQSIAEQADQRLNEHLAAVSQAANTPVAEANSDDASQTSPSVTTSDKPNHNVLSPQAEVSTSESISSSYPETPPHFHGQTDPLQWAPWYEKRREIDQAENHLSQLLIDLNESHPKIQRLQSELQQLRESFQQIAAPPNSLNGPQPKSAFAQDLVENTEVSASQTLDQEDQIPNGLTETPTQNSGDEDISVTVTEEESLEIQSLRQHASNAWHEYEATVREHESPHSIDTHSQLAQEQAFHVHPASVVYTLQPFSLFRWSSLILLGLATGLVAVIFASRRRDPMVRTASQARSLVPTPILVTIPTNTINGSISADT